jgi:hypothetical protein
MILWIVFIVGCLAAGKAFDPNADPISRWMGFGITMICLISGIAMWITGRISDD